MLDVRELLLPERELFASLIRRLDSDAWARPTECPAWSVHGIALHVLGDDLSLLARQRDSATNGLFLYAEEHPGETFRQLLDGFNEQWVRAARFLSPRLTADLLELTGVSTDAFYRSVDPHEPGEPVGFFGSNGEPSPWWQVMAREYAERWIHHEQVRRALGVDPVDAAFADPAMAVVVEGFGARNADLGDFSIGERSWTFRNDGADIRLDQALARKVLSRSLTFDDTLAAMTGRSDVVERLASQTCQAYL
ncbi:MAG: maleylpyruvate isomerase family mycothiol-dependent enzyme [Acidimicrobiales bacterium]